MADNHTNYIDYLEDQKTKHVYTSFKNIEPITQKQIWFVKLNWYLLPSCTRRYILDTLKNRCPSYRQGSYDYLNKSDGHWLVQTISQNKSVQRELNRRKHYA